METNNHQMTPCRLDAVSKESWTKTLDTSNKLKAVVEGSERTGPPSIGESMDDKVGEQKHTVQPCFMEPDAGTPAAEALAANRALKVSIVTKGLRKLQAQKLKRKVKKLNIVKQLRKTTVGIQFSKNFKGKVIDGVHELYTLTAGMMLGMRCSVGRNHPSFQLEDKHLTLEDFSHVEKITFPAAGSTTTPPHSLVHTFKFKSYSLKVFRRVRDFFGIENADYMNSVCGNYNYLEFISNSKSGQFFFYSHDGKYMIKTQTKEENKFMKQILPHYYKFVTENPHTLLCRIVGMHRVKMHHLRRQVRFVIMTSVFDTPEKIHKVYDLKGSLVGRQASEKERANGGVLKDLDLVNDHQKLHLGSKKSAFMTQIKRDAMFLAQLNIMDYSLLVGIHDRDQRKATGLGSDCEDSFIFGPSGQHSNTPFRRRKNILVSAQLSPAGSAKAFEISSPASSSSPPPDSPSFSPSFTSAKILRMSSTLKGGTSLSRDGSPKHSPDGSPVLVSTTRKKLGKLSFEDVAYSALSGTSDDQVGAGKLSETGLGKGVETEGPLTHPQLMLMVRSKSGRVEFQGPAEIVSHQREVSPISPSSDEGKGSGGEKGDVTLSKREHMTSFDVDVDEVELDVDCDSEEDDDDEDEEEEIGLETIFEEEEHFDEGDSEEGTMDIARRRRWSRSGSCSTPSHPSVTSPTSSDNTPQRKESEDLGKGWNGLEGSHLSSFVRKVDNEDHLFGLWTEKVTFGPGASQKRPWTRRKDGGINSRLPDIDVRGREIYFCGVIDILQQYNLRKRSETFFKSFTNNRQDISSVDSISYATRFVKFLDENSD